jgi:hypothetical protein
MSFPDGFYHFNGPCFNERLMPLLLLLTEVNLAFDA